MHFEDLEVISFYPTAPVSLDDKYVIASVRESHIHDANNVFIECTLVRNGNAATLPF